MQTFLRKLCGPEKGLFFFFFFNRGKTGVVPYFLTAETVQGTSLSFKCIHYVHGSHGLPLGVLGVSDGVTDNVFQENFENTTSLFVDQTRNALHTATSCQTTDGGLRDTLDVIAEYFPVPLGTTFPQTFATFASTRHCFFQNSTVSGYGSDENEIEVEARRTAREVSLISSTLIGSHMSRDHPEGTDAVEYDFFVIPFTKRSKNTAKPRMRRTSYRFLTMH